MKYKILMSQEIGFRMIVEADNEKEAIEKANDDLNNCLYLFVEDETIDRQEVLMIKEIKGDE